MRPEHWIQQSTNVKAANILKQLKVGGWWKALLSTFIFFLRIRSDKLLTALLWHLLLRQHARLRCCQSHHNITSLQQPNQQCQSSGRSKGGAGDMWRGWGHVPPPKKNAQVIFATWCWLETKRWVDELMIIIKRLTLL